MSKRESGGESDQDPSTVDPPTGGLSSSVLAERYSGLTYEELVARLEELADEMSSGQLGIEAATGLYEEAKLVHSLAQSRLDGVRKRIQALDALVDESEQASD